MWCSLLIILIEGGMSFDVYGSFSNLSWYSECLFYLSAGFVLLYLRHKHDKINKKNTEENPAVGGATVGGTDCERGHTTNLAVEDAGLKPYRVYNIHNLIVCFYVAG